MSDQNINQSYASLKLIRRIEKLGRSVDQMDIVAYRYKQISIAYRQLALQCTELAEALDQLDVMAFEIR